MLLIAKLDRLSRNAGFIFTLRDAGVEFVCCDMPDANTLTVGLFAVLAQHERETISKRTKDALTAKKARGATLGTPANLTAEARLHGLAVRQQNAREHQANKQVSRVATLLQLQGHMLGDMAEPGARLDNRQHRRLDAAFVHVLDRHLRRPFRPGAAALVAERVAVKGRRVVMVDVDATGPWLSRLGKGLAGQHQPGGGCGADGRGQKAAPAGAGRLLAARTSSQQTSRNVSHDRPPGIPHWHRGLAPL